METMKAAATGLAFAVLSSTLAFLPNAIADYKGSAEEEALRLPLLVDSKRREGHLAKQLVGAINRINEPAIALPDHRRNLSAAEFGLFIMGLEDDQEIELNSINILDHLSNDQNFYGIYLDLRF